MHHAVLAPHLVCAGHLYCHDACHTISLCFHLLVLVITAQLLQGIRQEHTLAVSILDSWPHVGNTPSCSLFDPQQSMFEAAVLVSVNINKASVVQQAAHANRCKPANTDKMVH